MVYSQTDYVVRCEWGEGGIAAIAPGSDVIVIIDTLSFSTCVEIATTRGAIVYPLAEGQSAAELAAQVGANVAVHREGLGYSLSPASLVSITAGERLVLPSLNGSKLTALAKEAAPDAVIMAGCLRNARAVANAAASFGGRVAVIPAGERWKVDKSLRPALEDLIGAGAIISNLPGQRSPEAEAAVAVFAGLGHDLRVSVRGCASGRELIDRGFSEDVDLAAQLNCSATAAVLRDGAYRRLEADQI